MSNRGHAWARPRVGQAAKIPVKSVFGAGAGGGTGLAIVLFDTHYDSRGNVKSHSKPTPPQRARLRRRDVPDYAVIADVSRTLVAVLSDALSTLAPPAGAELHDLRGNIADTPARLIIFLYDVLEDPSARNRPRVRGVFPPDDLTIGKPPMALRLRYLMTPCSDDRLTDHLILGRTLQALYDDAILNGTQLEGNLALTNEALKVTLSPLSLDERSRVWFAIQQRYRLCVAYEVRVVNLDAETVERRRPVNNRRLDYMDAGSPST